MFNNNTQEEVVVESLLIGLAAYDQLGGDSLEVYVDNEIQNGVYNSDSGEYTFTNAVEFEANDAYVITVKFSDAAVEGNAISIDDLTLKFNSGSLSLAEAEKYYLIMICRIVKD